MIFPPCEIANVLVPPSDVPVALATAVLTMEHATFRQRLAAREIDGGRVVRCVVRHRDADRGHVLDLALARLLGSHFLKLIVGGIAALEAMARLNSG